MYSFKKKHIQDIHLLFKIFKIHSRVTVLDMKKLNMKKENFYIYSRIFFSYSIYFSYHYSYLEYFRVWRAIIWGSVGSSQQRCAGTVPGGGTSIPQQCVHSAKAEWLILEFRPF